MKAVIAAAGTGGHINPGLAIANKIKEQEKNSEIIFIGTERGLENDLVPRAGYELKKIKAYGIQRKITLQNIKNLYNTFRSIGEAKKILKEFKPDVVMVGFEDAKDRLPNAKNVVVTGTPTKIRKHEFTTDEKENIIRAIGLKINKPIVLVFGGSQGAKSINESLLNIIINKRNKDYQIMWAAGPNQYQDIKSKLKQEKIDIDEIENTKIVPYIYNMEEIINIVDLVVCRSGAMTITEISIVGKPAIFIPFPFATENHQEYNARVLEKVGAAKIILDKDLNSEILENEIENIVNDKNKMNEMSFKASSLAIKNVEDKIYSEIKKVKQK